MEQLINAAKLPCYATLILFILGGAFIFTTILIFTAANEDIKEEAKTIIVLFVIGIILLALGFHYKGIYAKYNNQTKSIVKNVIAKEYHDASDFYWNLDTGSFTENGVEYKIEYKKTINDEEKLIVTIKNGQSKDKNAKTLDIPKIKGEKNNGTTN